MSDFGSRVARWLALAGVAALVTLAAMGCVSSRAPRVSAPKVDIAALLLEADAELGRGCYLCLLSAAEKYDAAIAGGAAAIDLKSAGAWALVAARERELGLKPSGAIDRARKLAGSPGGEIVGDYLQAVDALPLRTEGVSKEAIGAAAAAARSVMGLKGHEADVSRLKALREAADQRGDTAARYLLSSLACIEPDSKRTHEPSPSALFAFQAATCGHKVDIEHDAAALTRLIEEEPRFHEAHYFLGRVRLAERKLVSAERESLAAANGLPRMTAAWATLGLARLRLEEYEWAAQDLARALDIEPDQREALLYRAQALNYAGRFEEAMKPALRLLERGNWYVSDANYWLAFSELQLKNLQDADVHVREARRTNPMNGDTARLGGLVAYHLAQFDRAKGEFDLAISRNAADCDSRLHLAMIHGQQERPGAAVEEFVRARDCYSGAIATAASKREEIERSSLTEVRKETALNRLAQRIEAARRSKASASLGAAEGEAARGAYDAAIGHAAEAEVHSDFTARVANLRARINATRARR